MSAPTPQQFLAQQSSLSPLERLEALVAVLRGPEGCPWDQKQTAASIIDFVIDEAHELKEALSRGETEEIVEELGDLAFTFTFLRQTLQEQAPEAHAAERVVSKMVQRHPHVFARLPGQEPVGEAQIKRRWEELKVSDKAAGRRLDRDLPASLPAWKKASKVLTRARNAGFRYPAPGPAWEKVGEEWMELQEALEAGDPAAQERELGDLLLALLTACQEAGLDGERALLGAAGRLADRLEKVEELSGRALSEIPYKDLASWYARARGEQQTARAFFNYCGVSPWPAEVSRGVFRAARLLGRTGLAGSLLLRQEREELRQSLARLVNGTAEGVTLVPNVSSACLSVAYSLDWKDGDTVLLGRHEFPANTVPWRLAARTFGLKVLDFDEDELRRDPEVGWDALGRILQQHRPRLLALSAVSYWSGYRLDIERVASLCRQSGTVLFIDAIQALGTAKVDMQVGIDVLAGGSHKNLLSPEGAGFLVVSPELRGHWVPRLGSWLSLPDPVDFLVSGRPDLDPNAKIPRAADPTVLEGGSQNALGYAGLSAAVRLLQETGVAETAEHVQRIHNGIEPILLQLGFQSLRSARAESRSAILSFRPPAGLRLTELYRLAAGSRIELSIPRGHLRFGCHLFNTTAEVTYLGEAMPELVRLASAASSR